MPEKTTVNKIKALNIVGTAIDGFYKELKEAPQQGRKICWQENFIFPPFLGAMDVAYFWSDPYSATVAARGFAEPLITRAEQTGYNRDVCSYGRIAMGAALLGPNYEVDPVRRWRVPRPDFLALADGACSMIYNAEIVYRNMFKIPYFTLDLKFLWDSKDEDEAVRYVVQQLKEFVNFLETMCNRRFNWEDFNRRVHRIYESATLRAEGIRMCATRPAPASFFDWAAGVAPLSYLLGRPEAVEAARAMKEEIEQRVKRKEGVISNEKCRLYWEGFMCWPKMGLISRTLAAKGALLVAGKYTHLTWFAYPEVYDPAQPLEFLARNLVRFSANRSIDALVDMTCATCEKYMVDGLVLFYARTCRTWTGNQVEVARAVSRRLGIPYIVVEGDQADASAWADAQVATRLEGLVETAIAQKRVK